LTWLNSLPEWQQALVLVIGIFAAIAIALFITWTEPNNDDSTF
jgi:uncharacterized protein involved in cysteine biosynthesis